MINEQLVFIGLCATLSICIGSFLNVVIHRLPIMMENAWAAEAEHVLGLPETERPKINLAVPASRCPHCGHKIAWYENVPVLSYVFLRGKCAGCKAAISLRYPMVEIATAVLSTAVAYRFGPTADAIALLFFVWSLVALTMIDFDTKLLPDSITLPLMWLGLLASFWSTRVTLEQSVIGAMCGYMSLWSVYWLFKLVTGKEGMGYGDFKLLAAIGAFLGWQSLPAVLLASSITGTVFGIYTKLKSKESGVAIPFGPFLSLGALITLFYNPML